MTSAYSRTIVVWIIETLKNMYSAKWVHFLVNLTIEEARRSLNTFFLLFSPVHGYLNMLHKLIFRSYQISGQNVQISYQQAWIFYSDYEREFDWLIRLIRLLWLLRFLRLLRLIRLQAYYKPIKTITSRLRRLKR